MLKRQGVIDSKIIQEKKCKTRFSYLLLDLSWKKCFVFSMHSSLSNENKNLEVLIMYQLKLIGLK